MSQLEGRLIIIVPILLLGIFGRVHGIISCLNEVHQACGTSPSGPLRSVMNAYCTSQYGGFPALEQPTETLIGNHLKASMQYLFQATHFNDWKLNRKGFTKFFHELSDEAFHDALTLIKHMSKRGGKLSQSFGIRVADGGQSLGEYESLTKALDTERSLAQTTLQLVHQANALSQPVNSKTQSHDGEFSHFLLEKFAVKQTDKVKMISSHVQNLGQALTTTKGDPSFVHYIYDTQILN